MADTEHPPAPPQYKRKTGATTPQPASRLKHGNIRSRPNTAEPQDHGRTSPSSTTATTTTIQGVRKFSKTLGKGHENSGQQKQQAQAGVPGQKNGGVGQGHLRQNSTAGNGAGAEEASKQVAFRIRGFSKKVEESTVVRYLQSLHPAAENNVTVTLLDSFDSQKIAIARFKVRPPCLRPEKARRSTWRLLLDSAMMDMGLPRMLLIDTHWNGLTPLCSVVPNQKDSKCEEMGDTVDIIAVAGPGEHAYETFRSDAWGDMWLQDFLPRSGIENIRVYTYGCDGYAAGPVKPGLGVDAWDYVEHNAQMLREEILRCRKDELEGPRRPLIFVCYSLGGILVLEALIRDITRTRFQSIANCCTALLMFGVPLQGDSSTPLSEGSQPESSSETRQAYVQKLVDDFKLTYKGVQVISFYELEVPGVERVASPVPSPAAPEAKPEPAKPEPKIGKSTSKTLKTTSKSTLSAPTPDPTPPASFTTTLKPYRVHVPRASATALSPQDDNDCCIGLKADHRGLVKFDDEYDQAFAVVRDRLDRCVKEARGKGRNGV